MKTPDRQQLFDALPLFKPIDDVIKEANLTAWLVGGSVRDLLLGRPFADIDLVCMGDPTAVARLIARTIDGHWFWLDEPRRQSRVVGHDGLQIDFAPLRADTLEADLRLRDFTINAMALALAPPGTGLIDPLGGHDDLRSGTLRMCSAGSFADDPLRMLKGIRHAVTLSLALHPSTLQAISSQATSINGVAGERIRDELLLILDSPNVAVTTRLLVDSGLLTALFGASKQPLDTAALGDHLAVVWDCLEGVLQQQARQPAFHDLVLRPSLYQLALLSCYFPADSVESFLRFLCLSRRQQALIKALRQPLSAEELNCARDVQSERQQALVVEGLHPFGRERLLYRGLRTDNLPWTRFVELLTAYAVLHKDGRIPDLLSGRDYPSSVAPAAIGQLQRQIKQAEISGRLNSREEASRWLEQQLSFDKN